RLAGTGLVPRVDLGLNGIPLGQQRFVLRNQVSQDFFELGPEDIRLHTGARGNFIGNQVVKNSCDLKTAFFDALRHVVCLDRWLSCLENRKVLPCENTAFPPPSRGRDDAILSRGCQIISKCDLEVMTFPVALESGSVVRYKFSQEW